MRPDRDLEKEPGLEISRTGGYGDMGRQGGKDPSASPPETPAKELPQRPAPLKLDIPSRVGSPAQPPNRPLPPRPVAKSAATPNISPPSRTLLLWPQAPLAMNPPTRPGTAATQMSRTTAPLRFPGSTTRPTWTSIASRRPIKYGQGKYGRVELVPQPSDDPDDPLNWPAWRKELNFWCLLLMVAMTGVTKTIFMTVNGQLAESFKVSYTAAVALTGVPLIVSALTGCLCLASSRICGKRPLYLASLLLMFIGIVWNTNVGSSYGQCMAARIFQGLGWGAFDTLVLGSIQDTYFEHERGLRVAIHSIVAVTTTWGPPLLGGVTSQGPAGVSLQFMILSTFFVAAVPAIALGAPETAFDRTFVVAQTPVTAASQLKTSFLPAPRRFLSIETFTDYIVKLKPYAFRGPADRTILLQVPRAFITPTTALLAIVSLLPCSSLWGLAASLSLFFQPLPFILSPGTIGALFTAPFLLATAAVAAPAFLPRWQHTKFTPKAHMLALTCGSGLVFIGVLTFGLHLDNAMTPPPRPDDATTTTISIFALDYLASRVNLPAVSFVLGLLAAGAHVLAATAAPLIAKSTGFTGSNLAVSTRNTADMTAAVSCWRALMAGVFVMGVPNAVWWWDGLRAFCIGIGVAQVVVAAIVGTVWWFWGERIRRWDGRVMGLVDLEGLKRTGSFFDLD
ncbi:major facilitator superfamily domain-containing protein [Achaetomium macrosporum]|uniref:Major facilitator superfamily domain-containing protein n=1 Tax=Achaetomium macrosporum TaxID=79813 RepID=A0AAN7H7D7_9PEZI|nr:major facilitator superfamily domain-containing protein [Achaetomium macrosporum]